MIKERTRREFGSLRLRGRIWWLRYRVGGEVHEESSGSMSRRQAERLLEQRKGQLDVDALTPPVTRRTMFAALQDLVRTDYRKRGLRSLGRLEHALTHLRDAFGAHHAAAITATAIDKYEIARLDTAARATVNYELAVLRRAFRLAAKARLVSSVPAITISDPHNERAGFFEPADFALVLEQLPKHLKPVMTFAYLTGWRVKSEVLPLTWDRVDFEAGVVWLEPNTTKNRKPRTFPFGALPELAALLEAQRAATTELERSAGRIIPTVFHRNGQPLKSYRGGWAAAVRRAASNGKKGRLRVIVRPHLAGRIVHDLRRTAVRNLVRAGVDEALAMKLTGHKTRSVFDRYNITSEADLRDGVGKLAAYLETPGKGPGALRGTIEGQSAGKGAARSRHAIG